MKLYIASLKNGARRFFLALAAVLAAAAAAGGAERAEDLPPVLFDARERLPRPDISGLARIRFLTSADFPPFNFADQTGRLAGFHVDLAREICAVLAVEEKCQIQSLPFADLETALAGGQGEAVIAGTRITAQLRERFAFSRPYLALPARFAATRKAAEEAAGEGPASGWRVGTVSGTVHEAMFRAWFPQMEMRGFDSHEAMLAALREGAVDAVFSDALRLSFWVPGKAAEGCCVAVPGAYVSERFLGEGLAIMVRRQDGLLAEAFDHALAELARNGRMQELYLRYFPYGLF